MYRNKLIVMLFVLGMSVCSHASKVDKEVLLGQWQLDMTPNDVNDSNFALMNIEKLTDGAFVGEFYRKGVRIQKAQLNTQLGVLHGALISEDNSGQYNSSFYLKNGILFGTTHAVDRGFLAVWTAKKIKFKNNK